RVDLRPDGRLYSRAGAVRSSIAARADQELGRVEVPERGAVSFSLESAAPVGASRTSDTEVSFDDVMVGVDLEVTSTNLGLKEMIVLESADAPSSFRYRVTVEGGLAA